MRVRIAISGRYRVEITLVAVILLLAMLFAEIVFVFGFCIALS